jgi:hypothetical protein
LVGKGNRPWETEANLVIPSIATSPAGSVGVKNTDNNRPSKTSIEKNRALARKSIKIARHGGFDSIV